jgi:uncharacterized membrane protein YdcZ (DUF606 family)
MVCGSNNIAYAGFYRYIFNPIIMRTLGIVLIVVGIIALVYTGFSFTTKEKVAEIGPIDINKKEKHTMNWSPIAGIVLLIGGIALLMVDKRK